MGTFSLTEQEQVAAAGGLLLLGCVTAQGILNAVRQSVAVWNASQIATYASSSSDPEDDSLEADLAKMNIQLSGQLANKSPNFNDDGGGKDPRRSQTTGLNQNQNKQADQAANEAGLNAEGRAALKKILEDYSRGAKGDDFSLDFNTILQEAKQLATSAKYRLH